MEDKKNTKTKYLDFVEEKFKGNNIEGTRYIYNDIVCQEIINECHKYNIPVLGFIPSKVGHRPPLYEGLPSIENQEWVFYDHLGIDYLIKGDGELAVVTDGQIFVTECYIADNGSVRHVATFNALCVQDSQYGSCLLVHITVSFIGFYFAYKNCTLLIHCRDKYFTFAA